MHRRIYVNPCRLAVTESVHALHTSMFSTVNIPHHTVFDVVIQGIPYYNMCGRSYRKALVPLFPCLSWLLFTKILTMATMVMSPWWRCQEEAYMAKQPSHVGFVCQLDLAAGNFHSRACTLVRFHSNANSADILQPDNLQLHALLCC